MFQADLTRADARDAEFTPGDGSRPVNLEDAVLRETDLRGADLSDARLYQADLTDTRINRKTDLDETTVYEQKPEMSGWFRDTTDAYGAAAWVHRRLERLHETTAASEEARDYHIRKQEAERKGHKRRVVQRLRELWPGGRSDAEGEDDDNADSEQEEATDRPDDTEEDTDSEREGATNHREEEKDDADSGQEEVTDHSDDSEGDADSEQEETTDRSDSTTNGPDETTDHTDNTANRPDDGVVSAYRYLSLSLMYYLTEHGENLQLIGKRAAQIIVVAGLLYPVSGGVASSSTGTVHEFTGGAYLAADTLPEALSVVGSSLEPFAWGLYFSVITFTTIGYGDLYPVGTLAKVLVGIESLSGAVLVALFVFVLGRRVAR